MVRRIARPVLLGIIALVLSIGSAHAAAPPAAPPHLSPADEGLNAEIVLSPGKSMAQARALVAEINRRSRQAVLNKNEQRDIAKEMLAQLQRSAPAVQPLGLTGNSFDGQGTAHGAILVAYNGLNPTAWCAWLTASGYCHAGLFNRGKYRGDAGDRAIRTANTDVGVKYEAPREWQKYMEVREMKVNGLTANQLNAAVARAEEFAGPFSIYAPKWSDDAWYCAKVVYRAFYDTVGISLDGDGGYWVLPGDLRWDYHTSTVKIWV